jgi:hypothetical protein
MAYATAYYFCIRHKHIFGFLLVIIFFYWVCSPTPQTFTYALDLHLVVFTAFKAKRRKMNIVLSPCLSAYHFVHVNKLKTAATIFEI